MALAPSVWRLWPRLGPTSRDAVLAGVAAVSVFSGAVWERGLLLPTLPLAAWSLAVATPLAVCRRLPLSAAAVSAAVGLGGTLMLSGWSGRLVAAATFCGAAYHRPGRVGSVLMVSVVSFLAPISLANPFAGSVRPANGLIVVMPSTGMTPLASTILVGVAPVAVGYALRLHRDRIEQAARLHRAEAGRVVEEERASIARDVHDAVGHYLTAIRMQAAATRHVRGGSPAMSGQALATIAELASAALVEVRTLLHTLNDDPEFGGVELADVPALAERLSTPARRITVTGDGEPAPLPALVEYAGYRLVQEALTNAVRHSQATDIRVQLRHAKDAVTITVEDNGAAQPSPPVEGRGIRGMRERTRRLGGTLTIATRHPHGWRVHVVLPVDGSRT